MNICGLLQLKGFETSNIQKLFEIQDFDTLYDEYSDVIKQLLFLESKAEFEDFINEEGQVEMEPFLFAYATCQKACLGIGMYEENIIELLQNFAKVGSDVELSDDMEKLVENMVRLNECLSNTGKKYIVFMDETYCEGCYYVFLIEAADEDKWDGALVERIL